jgi:hypothetical protein
MVDEPFRIMVAEKLPPPPQPSCLPVEYYLPVEARGKESSDLFGYKSYSHVDRRVYSRGASFLAGITRQGILEPVYGLPQPPLALSGPVKAAGDQENR